MTAAEEKGRAGWAQSEEVLEGALLNAVDLLRRLEVARLIVAEMEHTVFAAPWDTVYLMRTLSDAASHIRSCQWLGGS